MESLHYSEGSEVTRALRSWLENGAHPPRHAHQALRSAHVVQAVLQGNHNKTSHNVVVFTELNCILFKRIVELDWLPDDDDDDSKIRNNLDHRQPTTVSHKRIDNPVFLIAKPWFEQCPAQLRGKLVAPLRKLCLDALDELKQDFTREYRVIDCLHLLHLLMQEPDFPEFSLTFLKVQRFSIDAVGRHLRRNDSDVVLSARSCLASLRILFKFAPRALFDATPSLLMFFEAYPRWRDSRSLGREVLRFCVENASGMIAISQRRSSSSSSAVLFTKHRAELMDGYLGYVKEGDVELQGLVESLVETWTKELPFTQSLSASSSSSSPPSTTHLPSLNKTTMQTFMLEVLAEDSRFDDARLPAIVIRCAPSPQLQLEAIRACLVAEQEGAVPAIPVPVLDAISDALLLQSDSIDEEFTAELASGLLNSSPATAGRICWILGEFGPQQDWRAAFDGVRAFAAIVNLSDYERIAAMNALVKFASSHGKDQSLLLSTTMMPRVGGRSHEDQPSSLSMQKMMWVDYRRVVVKTLEEMSIALSLSPLALRHRNRCLQMLGS